MLKMARKTVIAVISQLTSEVWFWPAKATFATIVIKTIATTN